MGYLKERHGLKMIGKAKKGCCEMCGVQHPKDAPHNRQSLTYQYKFYDKHGRWPTWADAMSHCSEEVKAFWVEALGKRGIKVEEI